MATVTGGGLKNIRGPAAASPRDLAALEDKTIAKGPLNGGMISVLDKSNIPDGALSLLTNARVRDDKVSKRSGLSKYTPTKPDALRVQLLFEFKQSRTEDYIVRITPSSAYYSDGDTWTLLTGTLHGGVSNPPSAAIVLNTPVVANGIDRLQKITLGTTKTIADLSSNAPRARYVTGFANRVVCASEGDGGDGLVTTFWSAERILGEFDATVEISAGFSPIIESPADFSDFITGVFGFSNVLILTRERSIWLASKLPSASNPFNFFNAVPGIGCNVPASIAMTRTGIVFFDTESENVWLYEPGRPPEAIGDKIRTDLLSNFESPFRVFGGYNPKEREYMLGIPQSGSTTTRVWVYNFRTKAWAYDEVANLTAIIRRHTLTDYTSLDDLTGTFDALSGTFDELSDDPTETVSMYFGRSDGDILKEDSSVLTDDAVNVETIIQSKEYKSLEVELILSLLMFEYTATTSGTTTLEYTTDGGTTWTTARSHTTLTTAGTHRIKFSNAVRANRLMWRIRATDTDIVILDHIVKMYVSGDSDE